MAGVSPPSWTMALSRRSDRGPSAPDDCCRNYSRKLTLRLHQELPYQLTVETDSWEERKDGSTRIEQIIYVMRNGHKGILLGAKGDTIKKISMAARKELETLLERKVHLFVQIKVRAGWIEEAKRYSAIGLSFKDGNA